jgi:accessory gene regulator protein AgrB
MSGAIQLLHLYAFMAWRGSILCTVNWLLLILVIHYVQITILAHFYLSSFILPPLHVPEAIHR